MEWSVLQNQFEGARVEFYETSDVLAKEKCYGDVE